MATICTAARMARSMSSGRKYTNNTENYNICASKSSTSDKLNYNKSVSKSTAKKKKVVTQATYRDLTTSTPYLCSEEYILLVGISLWLVLSSLGDSFTKIPMIANSRASSHSRILLSLARTNAVRILFQEERSVVYLLLLIMAKKREK